MVFFIINGILGYLSSIPNEQKYKIIIQSRSSFVFMSSASIKTAAPDIAEAAEKKNYTIVYVYFLLPCVIQSLDLGRTQSAAVAAEVVEFAVEVGLAIKHLAVASKIRGSRSVPHVVGIHMGALQNAIQIHHAHCTIEGEGQHVPLIIKIWIHGVFRLEMYTPICKTEEIL